jgi:hypothetical protein
LCLCLIGACATRRINFPTDTGTPLPDAATIHQQVSAACRGVRTLTMELALSGRAGSQRLRGRVIGGFERPASMRLEGVAPFGPPAFILVTRGQDATLVLPRDNGVVRGARAEEILGALTGVALAPADLQAVLTGCVEPAPEMVDGRLHQGGWASITLRGGAVVYLQQRNGAWQVVAARRDGWAIEYPAWQAQLPQQVHLQSTGAVPVDLTARVSQLETNVDVDASAFDVTVPPGAVTVTLEELRESGPLRGQ